MRQILNKEAQQQVNLSEKYDIICLSETEVLLCTQKIMTTASLLPLLPMSNKIL